MSNEHPIDVPEVSAEPGQAPAAERIPNGTERSRPSAEPGKQSATVLVRGETIPGKEPTTQSAAAEGTKTVGKQLSDSKVEMKNRLPALKDDPDVGVLKEQIVTRDDKADLAFSGTLVASAAPTAAPKGAWREYRVYETSTGKHVFSKITRSVYMEEQDTHEADVFDPAPTSATSQLLRSARDLTRSKPLSWTDAATHFFGYDPLAKTLYRKLSGDFEEHID